MKSLSCIQEHQSCSLYHPCATFGFKRMHVFEGFVYENKCQEHNQLLFVLSGKMYVALNQYTPLSLEGGQFVLLPVSASFTLTAADTCEAIMLTFREVDNLCRTFTLDSLKPGIRDREFTLRSFAIKSGMALFLDGIGWYLDNQVYCRELHALKQKELFYQLRYNYTRDELTELFYPLLADNKEFKTLVLEHFRETKGIPELAGKCGYSLSSFNRKFKTEFGCTPYKWKQQETSKQIFYELSVNKLSFSEIVFRFGFSSYSHLNTFCKKEFGMTPTELKKQFSGKEEI